MESAPSSEYAAFFAERLAVGAGAAPALKKRRTQPLSKKQRRKAQRREQAAQEQTRLATVGYHKAQIAQLSMTVVANPEGEVPALRRLFVEYVALGDQSALDDTPASGDAMDVDGAEGAAETKDAVVEAAKGSGFKKRDLKKLKRRRAHQAQQASVAARKEAQERAQALQALDEAGRLKVLELGILSLVEVLKNIVPGYRVSLQQPAADKKVVLSQQVKRVRRFEAAVVGVYARFVAVLRRPQPTQRLKLVAAKSLSRLLEFAWHFNHRRDVVSAVAPLLNDADARVRSFAFDAVCAVFKADVEGDASVDIVRFISRLIKSRGHRVRAPVLDCLLSLPLRQDILNSHAPRPSKKEAAKRTRGGTDAHVLVHSAEVPMARRKRSQLDMLTELFTVYFRILKHEHHTPALRHVLRGLARFSALISLDLVLDLLEYLKRIVQQGNIDLQSALHCIIAAMETLEAHRGSITVDPKDYYTVLYGQMWRLCLPQNYAALPQLLHCIKLMFSRVKQCPTNRAAAFVKRLSTLVPYLPAQGAAAVLHAIRKIITVFPQLQSLLDVEEAGDAPALTDLDGPAETDPDLVQTLHVNASLDLYATAQHFHPAVAQYARQRLVTRGAEGDPDPVMRVEPAHMWQAYEALESGAFNPAFPVEQFRVVTRQLGKKMKKKKKTKKMVKQ